jgi:hypothetical protein
MQEESAGGKRSNQFCPETEIVETELAAMRPE